MDSDNGSKWGVAMYEDVNRDPKFHNYALIELPKLLPFETDFGLPNSAELHTALHFSPLRIL